MTEHEIFGVLLFSPTITIIVVILLLAVFKAFIKEKNKARMLKVQQRIQRRECWIVGKEEFETLAKTAYKLESIKSFDIEIGKTNRTIKVLMKEKEQNYDQT